MTVTDLIPEAKDGSEFVHYDGFSIEYRDASHGYWICRHGGERTRAISVTSALKILDKPALLDWAEDHGARGAIQLARLGELEDVPLEDVIRIVRAHGLGKDAKRDAGADRGTAVHTVLQTWATEGKPPKLAEFDPAVRGYVQGLTRWLLAADPLPISVEKIVGCPDLDLAGRMDMRALIEGRDLVVDLKTNPKGRVYMEAHAQAAAYAHLDAVCGAGVPDGMVIVAVGEDGTYEQVDGDATFDDYLTVLNCHRAMGRLKRLQDARWRAAKKEATA